jgi:hypothetical protein
MKFYLLLFIGILLNANLTAQTKNQREKRFIIEIAQGVSNLNINFPNKSQNSNHLALGWKLGYMINTKFGLVLNGAVSIYEYDLSDRKRLRDFGGLFASGQYFVSDKIWILGGLGIGTDAPVFFDLKPENEIETKYYSGYGAISSVGYELFRFKKFAIDLQARFNYSNVKLPIGDTNGLSSALLLGISF